MSRRRASDSGAPFQTIDATSRITGLSRDYIRRGVRSGDIPAIKIGSGAGVYMIDVAQFLEGLHRQSIESAEIISAGRS